MNFESLFIFSNYYCQKQPTLDNKEIKIIVWGGLRGGLSIALVLSLPDNGEKNILLIATLCTVQYFNSALNDWEVGKEINQVSKQANTRRQVFTVRHTNIMEDQAKREAQQEYCQ